nr:pectinesterase inhibitor 10-like [Setaria viridis]
MLNPSSSAPRSLTTRPPPPSSDDSECSSSPPRSPPPPPPPLSSNSSDLEVNLEDDPDRESDSEEEDLAMAQQGPWSEEVAVLNSLETARHTLEISAIEAEHATQRKDHRVAMELECRRCVAARKEWEEAAVEKERKGQTN